MMRVKDLMEKEVITIREDCSSRELLILILKHHTADFPVVDSRQQLKGMIYERDLLTALYPRYVNFGDHYPDISDLGFQAAATQTQSIEKLIAAKVFFVSPEDHIMKAASAMLVERVSTVPVVADGVVVGLIRQNKIFTAIMSLPEGKEFQTDYLNPAPGENPAPLPHPKTKDPVFEKRLYKRVKVNMTAAYKITSLEGPAAASNKGYLVSVMDASAGGILLRVEKKLPLNTLIHLAFDLSGQNCPMVRMGRVVRCEPSKDPDFYEAGIMFIAMTPEEIRQIEICLNRLG